MCELKPRLLDLFCGAGGCSMGYHRAGFEVVGVDILPMKDYPFEFHQADALTYPLEGFDVIHASPPCQKYSSMQNIHKNKSNHPDLINPIRERLIFTEKPFVIKNVKGSCLDYSLMLCGTMFGLNIIRHRYFEIHAETSLIMTPCCHHDAVYDPWHGKPGERSASKFRQAMGIDWVRDSGGHNRKGTVSEAIPPAYTEFIGRQLMEYLRSKHV
jgi:hypothetical protein